MTKGKAPGPDGLSIEFYIHSWSIVKHEIIDMLRELFSTQFIKPQIKAGCLTLIHKKAQKPNYKLQINFALELRPKNLFEMPNEPSKTPHRRFSPRTSIC